jgi:hypothetical protein
MLHTPIIQGRAASYRLMASWPASVYTSPMTGRLVCPRKEVDDDRQR